MWHAICGVTEKHVLKAHGLCYKLDFEGLIYSVGQLRESTKNFAPSTLERATFGFAPSTLGSAIFCNTFLNLGGC